MRRGRRFYYDLFSRVYDKVIALHSADKAGKLRSWLVEQGGCKGGMRVLDLCTGTGSVAIEASRTGSLVVGLDFSWGMLEKARDKGKGARHLVWVQGSAPFLPFRDESFHVVYCSHAFYELRDWEKLWTLGEVKRVLLPGGCFLMMEHEEPSHPVVRFLYKVRLASMGSLDSSRFISKELKLFSRFFKDVVREKSPTGNSKLIKGVKR